MVASAAAAVVMDPVAALEAHQPDSGPGLSQRWEEILLGMLWTLMVVIGFGAVAMVGRYWASPEWSRFITAFAALSAAEWILLHWIAPLNRMVKRF